MGSFDKQTTASSAKAKQARQIAMCVGLGLCLLVVVAFQVMKATPRPASAGENHTDSAAAVPFALPTESVSDAMSQLSKDPTDSLLRSSKIGPDPALESLPRDPFKMSNKWIASLKRPDHVAETPITETVVETPVTNTFTPAPALKVNTETLKLQGIVREGASYTAILNGSIVKAGTVWNNIRVLKVLEDRIIVQHAESPRGPTSEVVLKKFK